MNKLLQHIKLVAKDDIRLFCRVFFAPFVALFSSLRIELQRPPVTDADEQHTAKRTC